MKNKNSIFRLIIITIFVVIYTSCNDGGGNQITEPSDPNNEKLSNCDYDGRGTPLDVTNPAPKSWSGKIEVNNDDATYYIISNWANKVNIFLDDNKGEIRLNLETAITKDDNNNYWCLGAGYFEDDKLTVQPSTYKFVVEFDSETNILDFSRKISGNDAVVGIVVRNENGDVVSFFGDTFYSKAKLELTPDDDTKSGTFKSVATPNNNDNLLKPSKKFQTYEKEVISMDKVRYLSY